MVYFRRTPGPLCQMELVNDRSDLGVAWHYIGLKAVEELAARRCSSKARLFSLAGHLVVEALSPLAARTDSKFGV